MDSEHKSRTATIPSAFARFGDSEQMKQRLNCELSRIWRTDVQISDLAINHLRHRLRLRQDESQWHKSSVLVSYSVTFALAANAQQQTVDLHLQGFLDGRSRKKFGALDPKRASTEAAHLLVHLPDLDAIAWTMPNDPTLPALKRLLDPDAASELFPYSALPSRLAGPDDIGRIELEVVRYKPMDRCIVRYSIMGRGSEEPVVIFGKFFKDDRGQGLHNPANALWQASTRWTNGFVVAQSLGTTTDHDGEDLNGLWLSQVPGKSLTHAALRTMGLTEAKQLLVRVASGLAQLHSSDLTPLTRRTVDDDLADAQKWVEAVRQQFPTVAQAVNALLAQLRGKRDAMSTATPKPVHGAFRIKQLLVDGATLGVVDFDGFALADPLIDVADFLIDIHVTGTDPARSKALMHTFLGAYITSVSWPVDPVQLGWHIQLQLLRRIFWMRQKGSATRSILPRIEMLIADAQKGLIEGVGSLSTTSVKSTNMPELQKVPA